MTAFEEEKGKCMECERQQENQKQRKCNREHEKDCNYWSWRWWTVIILLAYEEWISQSWRYHCL
jgi:hypothetical protein